MKLACCISLFTAAISFAQNSEDLQQRITEGRALMAKGDALGALDAFRKAIVLSPQSAELHDQAGFLLAVLKRGVEAREEFQKAVALNDSYALAHYHLGVAYCLDEDYPHCIPELQKAAGLDAKSFVYRSHLDRKS